MAGGKTMRRGTSKRKTQKQTKSLAPKTRQAVAKIAKAVVDRAVETKYVAQLMDENPIAVYGDTIPGGGGIPQLWDALPTLMEGTAEYQRTGVKVQPVKHRVDLDLRFNNTVSDISKTTTADVAAWDITAYIWYGYVKRYRNGVDVLANKTDLLQQHLEDGQGNTTQWQGSPYDDLDVVNKEVFTNLKCKQIRMYKAFGQFNDATVAGGVTEYFPMTYRKRVSLSFKPPKTLEYDEVDNIPQNYAPIIIIGYQHNDNTQASNTLFVPATPTVLNTPALIFNAKLHLWFKDA